MTPEEAEELEFVLEESRRMAAEKEPGFIMDAHLHDSFDGITISSSSDEDFENNWPSEEIDSFGLWEKKNNLSQSSSDEDEFSTRNWGLVNTIDTQNGSRNRYAEEGFASGNRSPIRFKIRNSKTKKNRQRKGVYGSSDFSPPTLQRRAPKRPKRIAKRRNKFKKTEQPDFSFDSVVGDSDLPTLVDDDDREDDVLLPNYKRTPCNLWTVKQVCEYLEDEGFGKWAKKFKKREIGGNELQKLSVESFEEMNIPQDDSINLLMSIFSAIDRYSKTEQELQEQELQEQESLKLVQLITDEETARSLQAQFLSQEAEEEEYTDEEEEDMEVVESEADINLARMLQEEEDRKMAREISESMAPPLPDPSLFSFPRESRLDFPYRGFRQTIQNNRNDFDEAERMLGPFVSPLGAIRSFDGDLNSISRFARLSQGFYQRDRNEPELTYDQLVNLPRVSTGVKNIERFTVVQFKSNSENEKTSCMICLSDFEDGEEIMILPCCLNKFHNMCISKWLEDHNTCPVDKYNLNE